MPNTLTGLIPHAYAALNVVSRELVGFIPAVYRDGTLARAAVNQEVKVPITPKANVSDISAQITVPDTTDQTIDNETMRITKSRAAEFGYTGEETVQLDSGPGFLSVQAMQIVEGLRALTNEIETDVAKEAAMNASRAYGTAGTAPFGSASGVRDSAQIRKILDDNGAPMGDRHLIVSTSAGANLRTLSMLNKVNESGEMTMLRQGVLGDLHGAAVRETGQAYSHIAGTAAALSGAQNFEINGADSVGSVDIALDGGASASSILSGDVISVAGNSEQYVVKTGFAAATSGSVKIHRPGVFGSAFANDAVTDVKSSYTSNVYFTSNAVVLATRLPDLPKEGDIALDRFSMQDPRSGLVFEIAVYPGYRKIRYEVAVSWGVKAIKPEHIALLLG